MNDIQTTLNADAAKMRWRKINLADGRYMIFYTFGERLSDALTESDKKIEFDAHPEAAEEKNV